MDSRVILYGDDLCETAKSKGIVTLHDKIIWLDYSCSGIELDFEGTEIEIEIVSRLCSSHYAWIEVCVAKGDSFVHRKYIVNRHERHIVFRNTGKGEKTKIILLKRTEKKYGDVGIRRVSICGKLNMGQNVGNGVIEFIGDSISCGYGVEGFSLFHPFSTKYENGLKAFPYLLCEMLHMDYRIIACSGMGVWKSHRDYTGLLALEQYEAENQKEALCYEKKYIIMNLGTNDSQNIREKKDMESFRDAYKQLLKRVRERNPDSYIICAIGPMKCCLKSEIMKLCESYRESGDNRILFIRLDRKMRDGIGKGRHPTYLSQKRIAGQLYRLCTGKGEAGLGKE